MMTTFTCFLVAAIQDTSTIGNSAMAAEAPDGGLLLIAIALLLAGVILFLLEVFLPSGGVLALLSASTLVAAVVVMFMFDGMLGIALLLAYFILIPVSLYWGLKVWRGSAIGHKLILGADTEGTDDEESIVRSEQARLIRADRIKSMIGKIGIADSTLRPVGFVRIENERLDAIAEGEVIELGQSVEVVDAYDNQLKVRHLADPD
ncbi:MAG: hypothetical protein CBC35_01210 [Planctomycetes bacterium TMED75]|nr:hypothetical protein [Planctomycetaceae bacterium]OUU96422.1 MAG: hypothetical protein CBC35_01210 [Planctomycetes bacterium TMED75]